ncbi:MAG: chitobiase/beta-hexosaminidase C-terminal domain-containing protein, partial [Nodosilinea sp.]
YQAVLPLPKLEEVADHVRKGRVLLVISPDSEIPPEVLQDFFRDISQKNNLCVLTGEKTAMASLDKAARQLYAAQKADHRIPKGHPQREDLERKQQAYEQDFNATILSLFDQVKIPIQRPGRPPELVVKPLDMTRDTNQSFDGEAQIEKTLVANPPKLFLDIDKDFEALRDKAQDYLWPDNQDEARWSDMVDRYSEQAAMPWLPPRGLEDLKTMACDRHLWEDLKNGYLTKKPRQKTTSVQYYPEGSPNDQGQVRLRISPQDAGSSPRIHYAEDGPVSVQSPVLKEGSLETTALRVKFLAVDPSGQHETGDPITWTNSLTLRNQLVRENGQRLVKLLVAPRGTMRYTLDGSEPREGLPYEGPIAIGKEEVILRAFASADGLETKAEFRFPKEGDIGPTLDPLKPARLVSRSGHRLDSRAKTFTGLKVAADQGVAFSGVTLVVGQGNQVIGIN